MSTPLEHDYIGLSEASLLERSSDKNFSSSTVWTNHGNSNVANLKETELRLGLPGSESPGFGKAVEDKSTNGYNLSPLKSFILGAKRGFSDAISVTGKWDSSINGGSGLVLSKGENLFSPKGISSSLQSCLPVKEVSLATLKPVDEKKTTPANEDTSVPASKAQLVGWPPIRSFRKNTLATNVSKNTGVEGKSGSGCLFVKVSMDGAPYLRKVDLKTYCNYVQLSSALEKMFTCFTIGQCTSHGNPGQEALSESGLMNLLHGSEYVLTYEDKDGDWMLVGDVPWEMFTDSCKRLRIMRSADAIGLAPKSMQKSKSQN